jgi:hypothetical protein
MALAEAKRPRDTQVGKNAGLVMNRYFFDVVSGGRAEYDYRGRELLSPEEAFQLAELIAIDLGVQDEMCGFGRTIKVCNTHGHEVFSVPVPVADLVAA